MVLTTTSLSDERITTAHRAKLASRSGSAAHLLISASVRRSRLTDGIVHRALADLPVEHGLVQPVKFA
jgi:hypothetical protein